MADNEERLLEAQLEIQLQEQRDSLAALEEALVSDPTNHELLSVHEELAQAIKDAEEGLFHLKRARLLRDADTALQAFKYTSEDVKVEPIDPQAFRYTSEEVKVEPIDPQAFRYTSEEVKVEPINPTDVGAESLEDQSYSIGSKCRFRHTDGRWYNGLVVGLEGSDSAKISFLTPTSENMMICKFFLQQRCRFGTNCRLSHGIDVPLSSLKKYIPTIWEHSLVGSSIWAISNGKAGIWKEAELEYWDNDLKVGQVVFRDDGSYSKLGVEAIALSEYAQMSEEEENDSTSEQSDSSDDEEDGLQGLGFLDGTALQRGIQTETAIFSKWENHTRGIASKIMANMGYREGMGLGVSGQGMLDPITVKVLPPKQSLDHALESQDNEENKKNGEKKRSRGGKRKRDKKFAAAARAAKEREELQPDVFSLINSQLAMHGEALNNGSAKKQQNKGSREEKKEDRRALVAYDEEVKGLKIQVEKLEEMVNRNRKEKVVYEAAVRKLNETRKALAETEAAHASAANAVVSKEKEKRWLKF